MSDPLDRFTPNARSAMRSAQHAAMLFRQDSIRPEHILLGLTYKKDNTALFVLREYGVRAGQIMRAVFRATDRSEKLPEKKPTLSAEAKHIIELTVDAARLLGNDRIGTAHFLLGLLRHGDSVALSVLRAADVDLDEFRTHIENVILQQRNQAVDDNPTAEESNNDIPPPDTLADDDA